MAGQGEPSENSEAGEEIIDAGLVEEADEPLEFREAKHRADTARRLAYILVGTMAFSVALHYMATGILGALGKDSAVENLSKIFNAWLPVISSLVGSAATYYFTREK